MTHQATLPATVWLMQATLRQGACRSITVNAGDQLRLMRGSALLSLDGTPAEWAMHAGDSFQAPRAGRLVIEALGHADLLSYCLHVRGVRVAPLLTRLAHAFTPAVDGFFASIRRLQLG
jgi:hypothetical protein